MAWLLPFKAGYYNPQKIGRIEECVSLPYDELETGELNQLQINPYHYSHVIRTTPGDKDSYVAAKHKLFGWFIRDVILFDKVASLYIYDQPFLSQSTVQRRLAVFARVAVEDLAKRLRLHEDTIEEYVEDSYQRIAVSQCHLEPLLVGYYNPSKKIAGLVSQNLDRTPLVSFGGEGENEHRIYQVSEPTVMEQLSAALQDEKLFLLDGHHRFRAAIRYQEEQKMAKGSSYTGDEPWNYVLVALVNMADEGFTPQPWNRLIKTLPLPAQEVMKQVGTVFKLAAIPFQDALTEKAARKKLRMLLSDYASKKVPAFGIALSQASTKYFLAVGGQRFSPILVDEQVIQKILGLNPRYPNVHYESQDQRAFERIRSKHYQVAFFTQTVSLQEFLQFQPNQLFMPRAFDFYPKVASGVVLYSFKYSV